MTTEELARNSYNEVRDTVTGDHFSRLGWAALPDSKRNEYRIVARFVRDAVISDWKAKARDVIRLWPDLEAAMLEREVTYGTRYQAFETAINALRDELG